MQKATGLNWSKFDQNSLVYLFSFYKQN